jgi:anti-anti-sigma regulatory factor
METDDLANFENEIISLAEQLKSAFKSEKMRWFLHEQTDTLYIELSGLEDMSEDIIGSLAEPILGELDLDFEEIILLPYS